MQPYQLKYCVFFGAKVAIANNIAVIASVRCEKWEILNYEVMRSHLSCRVVETGAS
ncbi:MAG: hypothetical protein RMX68_021235 [Aulosira sp. ZfuVER01]|nr:hypothetical protein [Aulosira sp. ZfuVER01]MDZ8002649.1 hypothetical protein [Aulosira sp. DedVER01a]MDZ8050673.1 hypothetical protein [Aulosira sp. ZfuCHP01]